MVDSRDVMAARAGDLAAYARIVEAMQDMVHAVSYRVLRRHEDAEDAAQDTFLRAFGRLAHLDDPEAFAGWLRALAIRVALNHRRRRRSVFVSCDDVADVPVLGSEDERWSAAQRQALATALVALSDEDRRICDRRYHGGWSVARLASETGVNEGSMAKRLQRIRERLRSHVETLERQAMEHASPAGLPARITELLARPRLADLPENPVARVIEALSSAFPGHEVAALPEIVDLAAARAWLGSDPAYIGDDRLQRIDGDRVLRYDLSLPMLQDTRIEGDPILRIASGKVYRRETEGPNHLEAFHQFEVLASDAPSRLDAWRFIGSVLRSIDAVLPGVATRLGPTEYPFCSRAWQLDVEDDDRWVEVMALGQYAPFVVRAMGGDPATASVFGAGYGLERLASVRFGIDDIRKIEEARVES